MSTSSNNKTDDDDYEPQEKDGGREEQEKKSMLDSEVQRQDENGHVHHDNSKDFVVRDGFPALRLPTDKVNDITSSSSTAVDKDSSSSTTTTTSSTTDHNKKKNVWWIDGDEPIPQRAFWAHEACFKFDSKQLPLLLRDSKHVFSARTREDGQAYSTGTTYFVPSIMKPRCVLEAMALEVFQRHTQHLPDGVVIPEQSGAEWWTLVLNDEDADIITDEDDDDNNHKASGTRMKLGDPTAAATSNNNNNNSEVEEELVDDDEVGLHFDADYGLEEQMPNLLLHPRLATVTYLTSVGAPTVVFACPSPHSQRRRLGRPEQNKAVAKAKNNNVNDDDNDVMLSWHGTNIRKVWLSHPKVGKHIAFDGRLLHGAPATFFPPADAFIYEKKRRRTPTIARDENEHEPPVAKKAKYTNNEEQEENRHENQRITFMVNIWINHCPLDAEPLDDEICEQLETPWEWWSPSPSRLSSSTSSQEKNSHADTDAANNQDGENEKVVAAATAKTPVFTWNDDVHVDQCPVMEMAQIQKWSSINDDEHRQLEPAGEEEVVICNRLVTVKYETTLDDLHQATAMAGLVEMNFEDGALVIQVGEKVESSEEDEEDDDECSHDDDDQKQAAVD